VFIIGMIMTDKNFVLIIHLILFPVY